jgi:hypothetical protein
MCIKKLLPLIAFFIIADALLFPGEISVIMGKDVRQISPADVKKMYKGAGYEYRLTENKALAKAFYPEYVECSFAEANKGWAIIVFTGAGDSPKELNNDEEVIKFVKNNPKAIGYISSASVPPDIQSLKLR